MAIAFRAVGTAKSVASGNLASIVLPVGHVANDILLLCLTSADNVVSTCAGYTSLIATNNGTGLRQTIFWKRDGGAESTPTVTHASGNSAVARIFAFSGADTGATPFEVTGTAGTGSGATSATSATATANGITPTHTNSAIIFVGSESVNFTDGAGTNNWASYSGTQPTFTEAGEGSSLAGSFEASMGIAWGLTSNGAATGSRTAAISGTSTPQSSTAVQWVAVMLALTDASPTGGGSSTIPNLQMAPYIPTPTQ